MTHKISVKLDTIIGNKDMEIEAQSDKGTIGTLLVSKGKIKWKPKFKSMASVHSYTWEEFAALMNQKGPKRKGKPYSGKDKSDPEGEPGVDKSVLNITQPVTGGATEGRRIGSGAGYVDIGLKVGGGKHAKRLVLPAGLSFVPQSNAYQNGVLVQDVALDIPAKSTTQYILQMYCANKSRKPPDKKAVFNVGPVLISPGLQELITLLKEKVITKEMSDMIQDAVWEVTDGRRLKKQTRAAIAEIGS